MFYKLDENKNVVKSSLEEWVTFIEGRLPTNYKHIGDDIIDGHRVSTVFLGLCHNFGYHDKRPVVFETMVFKSRGCDIYQERYCTWKEAEEGHQRAIQWVKNGCKDECSHYKTKETLIGDSYHDECENCGYILGISKR